MTTTTIYRAAGLGIDIDSIRSEVEGDLDLHGTMVLGGSSCIKSTS